jgi:hypothetical protein
MPSYPDEEVDSGFGGEEPDLRMIGSVRILGGSSFDRLGIVLDGFPRTEHGQSSRIDVAAGVSIG